ncbi:hypothetical protein D0Q53_20375 [Salmonella enterica]|nr:hypothetical protein [Salmonella enterica]EJD1942376.1 hypothetical protein [Escherichia coli]EBJ6658274.1 hypothetical protein [Salmonella enterica]EBL0923886.1 hypothetical protein [Salmonella enterica]ECZ0806867.1 hypothetical protein [Salmonella enterica]
MKLVNQLPLLKTVSFHGVEIQVPEETRYLAASANGTVTAYAICKPKLQKTALGNHQFWWGLDDCMCGSTDNTIGEVAKVDLEGLDWTKSIVSVE